MPDKKEFYTVWIALFGAIGIIWNIYLNLRRFDNQQRQLKKQRKQLACQQRQIKIQEKEQRDNRFAKAIELLGHENESVRAGTIYNLYYLAKDYPQKDYIRSILDVVCSHVRTFTNTKEYKEKYAQKPAADIQAVFDTFFGKKEKEGFPMWPIINNCRVNQKEGILPSGWDKDFRGSYLVGIDLNFTILENVHFDSAILDRASLGGAVLKNATFFDAHLSKVIFYKCILEECNFFNSFIDEINFDAAYISKTSFNCAEITSTNFIAYDNEMPITGSYFQGTKLENVTFKNMAFKGLVFKDIMKFSKCFFYLSTFQEVEFKDVVFTDVKLANLDLTDASFSIISFINVDLSKSKLRKDRAHEIYYLGSTQKDSIQWVSNPEESENITPPSPSESVPSR